MEQTRFKISMFIYAFIFQFIISNAYASNFSDLWKKHGGKIIDNKVEGNKHNYAIPIINIKKISSKG